MVSFFTIACVIISFLISFVLPVVLLALIAAKFRKQGIISAWLLGAAGFFVTQILIRIPIINVLSTQNWFLSFSQNQLFGYAFFLAFTAGLFELAGRFGVAQLLRKNLTFHRSLVAGLGHGGIEAMLVVGIAYVNNLVYIAMINSGAFDTVLAQTAAMGVDVSQLELIRDQLLTASSGLFLLGGFERILAMIAHTAMSLLVCYGVAHHKTGICALICLGIHTAIDLTAGISLLSGTVLSQNAVYCIIYLILTAVAFVSLFIIRELHRRWHKTEVSHDSEK